MKKYHTYKNKYSSFFDVDLDVVEIKRDKKNKRSTTKEFIIKAKRVHKNRFDYSKVKYINRYTNVLISCKEHNVDFFQTPTNHLSGWIGCPHCSYNENRISKGESKIIEFLEENDIDYVFQKRFKNCKYLKTLRFDFWLPKLNILIEFDGQQHYQPIEHWNGELGFQKQKIRDKIKNEFASEMNYRLLRISYDEYNNISNIISEFIIEE
jgi:very-short-patch-repair endonuclease